MKQIVFIFLVLVAFSSASHLTACHSQQSAKTSGDALPANYKLEKNVLFNVGSAEIIDESVIEHNARWLKANLDKVVVLEGHCDERGSRDFNIELGDRRARSVMKALMQRGVPENQLIIVSHGKDRPLVTARSENGWAQNRRVEFVVR